MDWFQDYFEGPNGIRSVTERCSLGALQHVRNWNLNVRQPVNMQDDLLLGSLAECGDDVESS
jgi:hypothetical protein